MIVYVRVAPLAPLLELGVIDTLTALEIVTWAVQLPDPLTPVPVAVTVMLSIVPPNALDGTVTVRVAFPLLNAGTVIDGGEMLGDHPALSVGVKEKVFGTFPVFVTVTV